MSTSLYYRLPRDDEYFGYQLKWAIAPTLWGHDGSLSGDWVRISRDDLSFLRGIAAGAPEKSEMRTDANKLIKLIERFGEIELCLRG